MPFEVQQKTFSGPLELLLELVDGSKQDITEISLAMVTGEFLKYVDSIGAERPEELADFLVIAARLLLLKSRALLPSIAEVNDSQISLEEQLKMYREFVKASEGVNKLWNRTARSFPREQVKIKEIKFCPPAGLTITDLQNIFLSILGKIIPIVNLPKTAMMRAVSIKEKIGHIRDLLNLSEGATTIRRVFSNATSKTEIIVSFLALLELVKQREIMLDQSNIFDDISISSVI